MKSTDPISRRRFLGQLSCAGVGTSTLISTLLQLRLTSNAVAQAPGDDYKALVCILLGGGNDSFNMLVPREPAEYASYAAIRNDLALPDGSLLPITDATGRRFGIHPGMPEVQALYQAGNAAFVANVGTLVRPTTLSDVENKLHLPRGLYSHADQIQHWQTSVPQTFHTSGWFGRLADQLHVINDSDISMNISLGGTNVLQVGAETVPYSINANGSTELNDYTHGWGMHPIRRTAMDAIMDRHYHNLFESTFAKITRGAVEAHESFTQATQNVTLNTAFPGTPLGNNLKMIARTIGARQALGLRRQTFFVMFGGWDHHDELLSSQAAMLPPLSQALGAFSQALAELGVENNVTTFTASDFGRSLTSNAKGSDHAWGGNQLVVGGAVNGGHIYGHYPESLLLPYGPSGALDTGRGRLLPTTSVDEFNAEFALWFGVQNNSDLEEIFPNIRNFFSTGGQRPLGFLGA